MERRHGEDSPHGSPSRGRGHENRNDNAAPARSGSMADRHPLLTEALRSPPAHLSTTPPRASPPARSVAEQHPILSGALGRPPLNTRTANGSGNTSLQSPNKETKPSEGSTNQPSTRAFSGLHYVQSSFEHPPATRSGIENTDYLSVIATTGGDTPMVLSPGSPSLQSPASVADTADGSITPMIGSEVHSISSSDVLLLQSDDSQQVPEASYEDLSNVPSSFVIQTGMPSTSQTRDEPNQGESIQESSVLLVGNLDIAAVTSPQQTESPLDLTVPERVALPRMPSLGDLFRSELFEDDRGTLRDRRWVSIGSLRQQVLVSEQQSSIMTTEINQPRSGTYQSTGTDTSSYLTQSSTSGQTVHPSQQVQSSEEERNYTVTETSEPSRNTSEFTSSGIPGNIDESTISEQRDGSSQQVPSVETESVGAGEPSRAHPSTNTDIPRNTSQSSSIGASTSGTTTQQNLGSPHRRF